MAKSLEAKVAHAVQQENFLGAIDLLAAHAPSIDLTVVRGKYDEYVGTKGSTDSYQRMATEGQFAGMNVLHTDAINSVNSIKSELAEQLTGLIGQLSKTTDPSTSPDDQDVSEQVLACRTPEDFLALFSDLGISKEDWSKTTQHGFSSNDLSNAIAQDARFNSYEQFLRWMNNEA